MIILMRKKRDKKYPPFAPGDMKKHFKMVTTSEYPWWLCDVSKQIETRVFQLSLPVFPTNHFVVVGEPSAVRLILTDPLSSRPSSPTMLSMNGHYHHAKRKAAAPAFSSNHIKRMTRVAILY